ncbi:dTDP-4-dehydrorhamnose 3,5-epimerase [bacterium]|nr:dTDP-4-dehydrorhamnose 3,5-epimerase [bacterium]
MPFHFKHLAIPDIILIEPKTFRDPRGYFLETYKHPDFTANGIPNHFVQDNLSHSTKNILRGLHYQIPPHAQGKLVMALQGEIFDVAVDIRKGSPTYGKWIKKHLSEARHGMLYIPPGFAHGFFVKSEVAVVMYKCTSEYSPQHDRGIIWNDPEIRICWPSEKPILSKKDLSLPRLCEAENPFLYAP